MKLTKAKNLTPELLIKENMKISQNEFEAYERVRQSGVTNMFDVRTVCELTGLERRVVLEIMQQYSELSKKYGKK